MPSFARRFLIIFIVVAIVATSAATAFARPRWKRHIDKVTSGHSIGVAVADHGNFIYEHGDTTARAPASNEKLLLSFDLLDTFGPDMRITTSAQSRAPRAGVINGNLWIAGRGDPTVSGGGHYGKSLPFKPTRLSRLAARIKSAGVTSITGRVIGSTGYFSHDWWARGWKRDFPKKEVALPSALTIDGNTHKDKHIKDPERRAAVSLTKKLLASGVAVAGRPGAGSMPHGLHHVASVQSQPLSVMMRYMDRQSSNFFAEMFGKRLAVAKSGQPGTIAYAAAAIHQWAADHGVPTISYDSSGLSYDDRVTPRGIVNLLSVAENKPWVNTLRSDLAGANQGTLEHRLFGVRVRAKTGTLEFVSALSGWVFSRRTNDWVSFSILSNGMYKTTAASIEDDIVRTLARAARPSS